MSGWLILLAGAGGALGALVRYAANHAAARRGKRSVCATMAVNAAGSFAIGLLCGWQLPAFHPEWYALAGTGLLGGMTTYSSLNVQKALLMEERNRKLLAFFLLVTYPVSLALTGIGYWAGIWLGSS